MIRGSAEANYLSVVTMLICTNDAFTGVNSLELPKSGATAMTRSGAYDAGTEENNEVLIHIVDPCGAAGPVSLPEDGQNRRIPTFDNISHHGGITGAGQLQAAHAWANPVIEIKVQRAADLTGGSIAPPRAGSAGLLAGEAPSGVATGWLLTGGALVLSLGAIYTLRRA
jgi:hypothetical protein